jgi:hypothetical protein
MTTVVRLLVVTMFVWLSVPASARASGPEKKPDSVTKEQRIALIKRAKVWSATPVSEMDIRRGPESPKAFAPDELVACEYVEKKLAGNSPKFTCRLPDNDEVKVKFGKTNGEVYAEVATTRLLWALGFGADRMYPVRIECHGCPPDFKGGAQPNAKTVIVEPASIERKLPGKAIETHEDSGWAWPELKLVDEAAGGAPRSEVDALRLLASLLQHTDSKPAQQRMLCVSYEKKSGEDLAACKEPLLMLNDVGLTFGHANTFNRNGPGSVNFEEWSKTPVWKDTNLCVGNISKSMTGTLEYPVIGEAGRAFLAGLLNQLTDAQLHDLFDVARFSMRSNHTTEEWVAAFKHKRDEVASRTCAQ